MKSASRIVLMMTAMGLGTVGILMFQNFTSSEVHVRNSSRLGVADYGIWDFQDSSMIQQRFDYYKQAGIGILRVDLGWSSMEATSGTWADLLQAPV